MRTRWPIVILFLSILSATALAELTISKVPVVFNPSGKEITAKIEYPSGNKPSEAFLVLSANDRLPLPPLVAEALYTLLKGPPSAWMYDDGGQSYSEILSPAPSHGSVRSVTISEDEHQVELVWVNLSYPPGTEFTMNIAALETELLPVHTFFKSLHLPDNHSRHLFVLNPEFQLPSLRVYPIQYDKKSQQVTFITYSDLIGYLAGTSKGLTTYTGPPDSIQGLNVHSFSIDSATQLERTQEDPKAITFRNGFDNPIDIINLTAAIMSGTASPLDRARIAHVRRSMEANLKFRAMLDGGGQESLAPSEQKMFASIHRTELHPPSSLKSPEDRLAWLNTEFIDDLTCAGATIRVGLHLNASSP